MEIVSSRAVQLSQVNEDAEENSSRSEVIAGENAGQIAG